MKKIQPDIVITLNDSDSALDAFCMSRGTRIMFIKKHLDSLSADNPNKAYLTHQWAKVEDAHRRNNLELLNSLFDTFINGLKAAVHTIPLAIDGEKFKRSQKEKAKKPRGKVSDGGETTKEIIGCLAKSHEHEEEPAKALWHHFYGELDSRDLGPREVNHPDDPNKSKIEYNGQHGLKQITFGHFADAVSKIRKNKSD